MFEIHVGELRATFLRNHNMRHHKDPTRKTVQAEDSPSRRHPKPGRQSKQKTTQAQKTPATPTAATTATSTGALHPLRGGAPVTWRCTRTEEVHCLRIGCTAPTHKNKRGTGTPNHSPPHPSMRTWTLLAAGWAHRPHHHLHSGPLRPTPTPPTPLHAKSRERHGTSGGPATSREALRTAGGGPGSGQRALAYRSTERPDAAEERMASTTRRLSRASSMVTCSLPTPRIASRKRSCSRARGSRLVSA